MTTPDTKLPIVAWFQDSGTLGGNPHYEQVHAQFAGSPGTFPLVRADAAQSRINALREELRLSRMTEAAAWLRVTEMQAECEALRKDSERLTWLSTNTQWDGYGYWLPEICISEVFHTREQFNAVIDALASKQDAKP